MQHEAKILQMYNLREKLYKTVEFCNQFVVFDMLHIIQFFLISYCIISFLGVQNKILGHYWQLQNVFNFISQNINCVSIASICVSEVLVSAFICQAPVQAQSKNNSREPKTKIITPYQRTRAASCCESVMIQICVSIPPSTDEVEAYPAITTQRTQQNYTYPVTGT